jgi:hypothetical protein
MRSFGLVAMLVLSGCTKPLSVEPAAGPSIASDDPTARMENCKSKLHEALDSRIRATEASLAKLGARRDELSKLSADQANRGDDLDPVVYQRILMALEATKAEIAATEANLAALAQNELQWCGEQVQKHSPTQA